MNIVGKKKCYKYQIWNQNYPIRILKYFIELKFESDESGERICPCAQH